VGNQDDPSQSFWPRRIFRWLGGFDGLPYLSRPTFRHEQAGVIAISIALSVTMGGFCLFLAEKGFQVPGWTLAALTASFAAGSFVGALLTGTLRRWRQPNVTAGCMYLAAAMTAAVVFLPVNRTTGLVFSALMMGVSALTMVGFQARVAIWQANYPAGMRGAIVSRNFIVQTILTAVLAQTAGAILDWRHGSYRVIYLVAAAAFVAAGVFFGRIRVRRETVRLKRDAGNRPALDPLAMIRVLRRDKDFAVYMALQMVLGSVSLAVVPIIPRILNKVFEASYSNANLVLMTIPLTTQILLMPVLGRLFDRISIFRFRSFGSAVWGVSRLVLAAGISLATMPVMAISTMLSGAGQTFGRLAWSAGHMDFAEPDETHLYMGVHMMLTGLRGLTMPFVGIWLYTNVMGVHLIWITAVVSLAVALAYRLVDPHRVEHKAAATPSSTYVP